MLVVSIVKLAVGMDRLCPDALQAELQDVRRRLRFLQKRDAKRKKKARMQLQSCGRRCGPSSPASLVVLVYSGDSPETAADFVCGRGWKKRRKPEDCFPDRQGIAIEVKAAYDAAPLSQIMALRDDPVKAGLVSESRMLTLVRWLVERSLYLWVEEQNTARGVAPSRIQLVEQALSFVPSLLPAVWQQKSRALLATSERSQRRWLASFRLRWGLRLGKLKTRGALTLAEKQSKDLLGNPGFGFVS